MGMLHRVSVFCRLPDPELARLAAATRRVRVPPGGVVVRQGQVANGLHIITRGSCRVLRRLVLAPADADMLRRFAHCVGAACEAHGAQEVVLEVARLGEGQFFGEGEGLDLDPTEDEAVESPREGLESEEEPEDESVVAAWEGLDLDPAEDEAAAPGRKGAAHARPGGSPSDSAHPPPLHSSSLVATPSCEMLFLPRATAKLREESRVEFRRFSAWHLSDCELVAELRAQYAWEVQKQAIVKEALGARARPVERKGGEQPTLDWAAAPREALRWDLCYDRTAYFGEDRRARIAAGVKRAVERMAKQPPLPLRSELLEAAMRSAQPAGSQGMRISASLPSLSSRPVLDKAADRRSAEDRVRASPVSSASSRTSALLLLSDTQRPPSLAPAARASMRPSISSGLLVSHSGARAYAAHRDPIPAAVRNGQPLSPLAPRPLLRLSPEHHDAPQRSFADATGKGHAFESTVMASPTAADGGSSWKRRHGATADGEEVGVVGWSCGESRPIHVLA